MRLDNKEFSEQLKVKLVEEIEEVCNAKTTTELIEELADVLEVITSFCDSHNFTMQDVINAQKKKSLDRGGFSGRKFVTTAEHQEGSFGEKYCLKNPAKYPEVFD